MSKKSEVKQIREVKAKKEKSATPKTTVETLKEIVILPAEMTDDELRGEATADCAFGPDRVGNQTRAEYEADQKNQVEPAVTTMCDGNPLPEIQVEAIDSLDELAEKLKKHTASIPTTVDNDDFEDFSSDDESDDENDQSFNEYVENLPPMQVTPSLELLTEIAEVIEANEVIPPVEELVKTNSKVAIKFNKLWVCLTCHLGKPNGTGEPIFIDDVPFGKTCGLCGKAIPSNSPAPKSVEQIDDKVVKKVDVTKVVAPGKSTRGRKPSSTVSPSIPGSRIPFGKNYNSDVIKVVMTIDCIGLLGPQGASENCEKEFKVETPGWKNLKPQFFNWKELKDQANRLGWLWRDFELLCPSCFAKYPLETNSLSSEEKETVAI